MNQKKIGEFISETRREKNLTQKELAEKLGVSVNAVSKWERGVCLMDMSLLKPLSNILKVSITEIINGEKDNNNADNAIENTIDYSKKQLIIERRKKYIVIIAALLIIFVSVLFSYKGFLMYAIDRIEENIAEIDDNTSKEYGTPIYINNVSVNDYYYFKNMRIKNVFSNDNIYKEEIDYVSYKIAENKIISIMSGVANNVIIGAGYAEDFINREYYSDKLNLKRDIDIYKFISEFHPEYHSIFSSVSFLEEYYFKCSLYIHTHQSFKEVREIRGDLSGYVLIYDKNLFSYHIIDNDVEYGIMFYGDFNFKETLDLINTVSFNNN